MAVTNRSPINTASGAGLRYWQDEDFTRYEARMMTEGVDIDATVTALQVTETAAGADMAVDIAAGYCLVEITRSGRTFKIWVENTASDNLAISSNSSGSTRYDLACVKVDSTIDPDTEADNMCSLIIVEGTGGAGVPATPSNHLKMAEIEVINGAVTIPDAKIVDKRIPTFSFNDAKLPSHANFPAMLNPDGFTDFDTVSGGSVNPSMMYANLRANSGAGNYANVKVNPFVTAASLSYQGDWDFYIPIGIGAAATQDGFWGFGNFTAAAVVPASHTSITEHVGFFLDDDTIYASNADGATQTTTEVLSITGLANSEHTFRFAFRNGSHILFFVDEEIVAYHTTNLASVANVTIYIGITATASATCDLYCYNNMWVVGRQDDL